MFTKRERNVYNQQSKADRIQTKINQLVKQATTDKQMDKRGEAKALLKKLSSVHLGNKLGKPAGLWNPQGKKACMSSVKSGRKPVI